VNANNQQELAWPFEVIHQLIEFCILSLITVKKLPALFLDIPLHIKMVFELVIQPGDRGCVWWAANGCGKFHLLKV